MSLNQRKLSPEEKIDARAFRDAQQAALTERVAETEPTFLPLCFLSVYRHPCEARGGVSTAIQLKEVYVHSEDGRWGFFYKAGECKQCGATALSPAGKFVVAEDRPPVAGRVAR